MFTSIAPDQRLLDQSKNIEAVAYGGCPFPAMESELESRLVRFVGKKVRMEIKIEPEILGGFVLRWGDRVIDASVKKKLELLGARLRTV